MGITQVVNQVLDFCYPRQCAGCGQAHGTGDICCGECDLELSRIFDGASCVRCAMPIPQARAPCPHCLDKGVSPLENILSLGVFKGPLKQIIHQGKYSRRWPLEEWLADRAVDRPDVRRLLEHTDCVVPVPLHRRRQISRGYNQAEVIARRIGEKAMIKVISAARRIRDTPSQTQIRAHAKRFENLRHVFAVASPESLCDKRVLLVDDVLTTGATLISLARTLKAAKPKSICALVMAVADPKGRQFEVI